MRTADVREHRKRNGNHDGDPSNNTDSAEVRVDAVPVPETADIAVTKVADQPGGTVGKPLSYTITVKNNGTAATTASAKLAQVIDALPSSVTFVSAEPVSRDVRHRQRPDVRDRDAEARRERDDQGDRDPERRRIDHERRRRYVLVAGLEPRQQHAHRDGAGRPRVDHAPARQDLQQEDRRRRR